MSGTPMRDVAIVSSAQLPAQVDTTATSVEMIVPVVQQVLADAGIDRTEIGFWCHGSCDYLSGQPFSFVAVVDALGAWPPIVESHVEADGAFALYEAWVKIQTGEVDSALVFSNGKSTAGPVIDTLALQLDPYTEAPLGFDINVLAALQARACLDAGVVDARAMADVVARSLSAGIGNPAAWRSGERTVDDLLTEAMTYDPLRAHDCAPVTDGANAIILAADDVARSWTERPVWIRGIDHRIDTQRLGGRDLTTSPSAALAARKAGVDQAPIDIAELHAPYSHQQLMLERALGLDAATVSMNPSGGALCANPQMAAGLARFVEAAQRLAAGDGRRAVAHCTSGPCLQQNLVAVLEVE